MMNKLIILISFICLCGCSYIDEPYYNGNIKETYNSVHDTINISISPNQMPYSDSIVNIYADNMYILNDSVYIKKNTFLYIEIINGYHFDYIDFHNTNTIECVEIVRDRYKRKYWCLNDMFLDTISIELSNTYKKVY